MFPTISWVSLGLVLAGIVVHCLVSPPRRSAKGEAAKSISDGDRSLLAKLKCLACPLALGSLIVLFITGFVGRLFFGELMTGYTLMLHVGLAPVFVVCLGFIVITWGHQCLLNDTDRQRLASLLRLNKPDSGGTPDLGWKLTFWLAMFLAVPASLSMVLGMFPIFGTHGQETLLCLHQYSSLALTLAAMIHVYLVIRRKALCS